MTADTPGVLALRSVRSCMLHGRGRAVRCEDSAVADDAAGADLQAVGARRVAEARAEPLGGGGIWQ